MNFFLILFLISLAGITFMIGRKLRAVANGALPDEMTAEEWQGIQFDEVRRNFFKIIQRLGYFLLVEIIRVYVRLAAASRKEWEALKAKLHDKLHRNVLSEEGEIRREPNKFLKAMAGYKRRLRKIKQEVQEEEGIE